MNVDLDDLFGPILFELQQNSNTNTHAIQTITTGSTKKSAADESKNENLIDLTGSDEDEDEDAGSSNGNGSRNGNGRRNEAEPVLSHANEEVFMVEHGSTSKKRKRELLEQMEELLESEDLGSEALKKLQKKALQCPICMEGMEKPASTRCGHVFCEACIQSWVKQSHKCPSCQKKIKLKDVHPIYI